MAEGNTWMSFGHLTASVDAGNNVKNTEDLDYFSDNAG
jgi:hypothetical protein